MSARLLLTAIVLALAGITAACGGGSAPDRDGRPSGDAPVENGDPGVVEITWAGQSMFVITGAGGTRVLLDPYGEIGYRLPETDELIVDVVTISHEHPDHNNVALGGGATVLRGLTGDGWAEIDERPGEDVRILSVASFHDGSEGAEHGRNAIFVIETGELRIAHLGDLGGPLTPEQIVELGEIEVLLVPVGGVDTIDAAGATTVVEQLTPRIVIPMHYKTKDVAIRQLQPVQPFLAGKVVREAGTTIGLDVDAMPERGTTVVWVLEPAGAQ